VKGICVIEDLCNGCRLCQTFCSSLAEGVFQEKARIRVLKSPDGDKNTVVVKCDGRCVRPINNDGQPTCVAVCPTGALFYAEPHEAIQKRAEWEAARSAHSLFKVIAPWRWPFPAKQPEGNVKAPGGGEG